MNFAHFTDTHPISETDRATAEKIFEKTVLSFVNNDSSVLRLIYDDYMAGMHGSVNHFETGKACWSIIEVYGETAVEQALNYWPGESAHFEITF